MGLAIFPAAAPNCVSACGAPLASPQAEKKVRKAPALTQVQSKSMTSSTRQVPLTGGLANQILGTASTVVQPSDASTKSGAMSTTKQPHTSQQRNRARTVLVARGEAEALANHSAGLGARVWMRRRRRPKHQPAVDVDTCAKRGRPNVKQGKHRGGRAERTWNRAGGRAFQSSHDVVHAY
jgi:hypothetical protein